MSDDQQAPAVAVVVQENPAQAREFEALLSGLALEVRVFPNAATALEGLEPAAPPALVVTGLSLPSIDGWQFCRWLRSPGYALFNEVPILFTAALDAEAGGRLTADLGANAFLPLPLHPQEFLALAQKLLQGGLPRRRLPVLIVEEDQLQAGALREAFEARGCRADVARTGQEAERKFRLGAYQAVILDHHLPDTAGLQLLASLKPLRPDTVFLAVAGGLRPSETLEWMRLGAAAVAPKPCAPEYLVELCANARREQELLRVAAALERRTLELRRGEARLREVLENSLDASYKRDLQTNAYEYFSPVFTRISGYSPKEMRALPLADVLDLLESGDRTQVQRVVAEALAGPAGVACQMEYRFRHKAGHYVWLLDRFTVVSNAAGQPQALIGSVSDITKRKHAELALEQEARHRKIMFEQSPDGLLVIDPQTARFLEFNTAAHRQLGYTREEFAQLSIFDVEARETPAATRERIAATIRDGRADFETLQRTRQGELRHVQVTTQLLDRQGAACYYCTWRDITERKRAEETLRSTNERLAATLGALPDLLFELDAEGRIGDFHSPEADLLYVPPDRFLGKTMREFLPAEASRVLYEALAETRATGRHRGAVYALPLSHGLSWFEVSMAAKGDPASPAARFILLSRDITARKQAEARLRQKDAAIGSSLNALAIGDLQGRLTYVNQAFLKLWGYEQEAEVLGRPAESFWEFPEEAAQVIERLHETGFWSGEMNAVHRGGARLVLQLSASLFTSSSGQPEGLLGSFIDITERKQTEARLRASEARHRTILHAALNGFCRMDRQGRLLEVNEAFCRMSGYSETELLARHIRELEAEESAAEIAARVQKILDQGQDHFETWHRRKDGTRYPVEVSAQYLPLEEGCLVAFLKDNTEHQRLEAQLRQSQKLEAVGQLAGGVAHDFNNILAAMIMNLGLLEKDSGLNQDSHDIIRELHSEVDRAASLIRQLLLFSRRSALELKMLDLNQVVGGLVKMLGRLLGEHIGLSFTPEQNLPAVKADPGMLEQVLLNLAVNARDAMPGGGRLTICTTSMKTGPDHLQTHPEARPGQFVCLAVADTGCGMDEATLRHLFEPFFTTKDVGKGTGLGLATVHGIVAQHQGWIEVESFPGQGSTFRVCLPASPRPAAAPEAEAPENPATPGGGETILVVEDAPSVRRILARTLRQVGYRVWDADSGPAALALWEEHRAQIDLLFTDMVMPEGLSGLDLARRLGREKPGLKVIIYSGYSLETAGQTGPSKGIVYLSKPRPTNALLKAIRDCLDQA